MYFKSISSSPIFALLIIYLPENSFAQDSNSRPNVRIVEEHVSNITDINTVLLVPPKEVIQAHPPGVNITGQRLSLLDSIPYIPPPVWSLDLVSHSYGADWSGYENILQRGSYAKATVARGGKQSGPAIVALYGMGDAAAEDAAAWGLNIVGYASAPRATVIANETDSGALVPGGIAYNTVLAATGYFQSENAIQIQANKPFGNFKKGIVFNNRAVGAINGSSKPISTSINAVSGPLIFSDAGTAESFIKSLSTFSRAEIDLLNFVVGPTYVPTRGSSRHFAKIDVDSDGVYIRAKDEKNVPVDLYLGSASTGSIRLITGGTNNQRESVQGEFKHTDGATDYITFSGGRRQTQISVDGASPNSSVSIAGKGLGGGKLRDGTSAIKMQWDTAGLSFNGAATIEKPELPADAKDLETAIALLNAIKAALIKYGLAK